MLGLNDDNHINYITNNGSENNTRYFNNNYSTNKKNIEMLFYLQEQ